MNIILAQTGSKILTLQIFVFILNNFYFFYLIKTIHLNKYQKDNKKTKTIKKAEKNNKMTKNKNKNK